MIIIKRTNEPPILSNIKNQELPKVRAYLNLHGNLNGYKFANYRAVAQELRDMQFGKCCFCEIMVREKFNDVEHFRPKAMADRRPGCSLQHGYWWLAYDWDNLLYSCSSCNRGYKKNFFPLRIGSVSLQAENKVPGLEDSLLIDPSSGDFDPVDHIRFELCTRNGFDFIWAAIPHSQNERANLTILYYGLNADDILDLRTNYVNSHLKYFADELLENIESGNYEYIRSSFNRAKQFIKKDRPFSSLAYWAFKFFVPDTILNSAIGESWPKPFI